ncbi:MAG: ABC transporter permease [Candidatus Bathyarchaeia archaeon]
MHLDVTQVFRQFYMSTVGSEAGVLSVLRRTTYLLVVSLGLAIAFRSGLWNIGGEGQILWGGLLTAAVGLLIGLPTVLIISLALVASFLAGGVWGLLAGFLKAKWNVNEIVTTLMLNFVAAATMLEVAGGPLRDPIVLIAKTRMLPQELQFPYLAYPLNVTFLIALALIPLVYILMDRTVLGYRMRIVGSSSAVATSAGMNVKRMIMLAMFLSGGICATAGSLLVFGQFFRAEAGMTGLFGFYAIVSTLLGRSKPQMMFFTSFVLAVIITGTDSLRILGVPGGFTQMMVGLLFIIAVLRELSARK